MDTKELDFKIEKFAKIEALLASARVVYETEWVAVDKRKKYEHGWGFIAPLVFFPPDADPAWCAEMCRQYLSNNEFECTGATPRRALNGVEVFSYPKNQEEFMNWKESH